MSYYWRESPNSDHIAQTAQKVVEILEDQGYILNGHVGAMCEAEIEDRLELAQAGRLRPIDHVKRIQRVPEISMFEIRWDHIQVTTKDPVSWEYQGTNVMVRLYYAEEGEPWVVGLRVHEKIIGFTDKETNRLQNEEIDKAEKYFTARRSGRWGVTELAL